METVLHVIVEFHHLSPVLVPFTLINSVWPLTIKPSQNVTLSPAEGATWWVCVSWAVLVEILHIFGDYPAANKFLPCIGWSGGWTFHLFPAWPDLTWPDLTSTTEICISYAHYSSKSFSAYSTTCSNTSKSNSPAELLQIINIAKSDSLCFEKIKPKGVWVLMKSLVFW